MIYRIQDKKGRGPWKPGFSTKWVEYRPDHENLPPWTIEFINKPIRNSDGKILLYKEKAFGCGCITIKQLKRWFSESEYKTLLKFGYRSVEIKPSRIIAESDIQCIFATKKLLKNIGKPFKLY